MKKQFTKLKSIIPIGVNKTFDFAVKKTHRIIARQIDTKIAYYTSNCNSPSVIEFIDSKQDLSRMNNVNISVMISDKFMKAVENDEDWDLVFPDFENVSKKDYNEYWSGDIDEWLELGFPIKIYQTIKAKDLWDKIISNAWSTGEPGILFEDNINKVNNYKDAGKIKATNPCFSGDTKIKTTKGVFTIKELSDSNKDVDVYSYDKIKNEVVIKKGIHPRITGYDKKLYKITFDDGSSVKATENHTFLLSDNSEKELSNLKIGDSLLVGKLDINTPFKSSNGKSKYGYNNIVVKGKEYFDYKLIGDFKYGKNRTGVLHHKDLNSLNDDFDNIELMTTAEHDILHGKLMTGKNNQYYTSFTQEQRDNFRNSSSKPGIKNGRFNVTTNDELYELTVEYIKKEKRIPSSKEFDKIFNVQFNSRSKYRKFKTYSEFIEFIKFEYFNDKVITKQCEWCGKDFKTPNELREVAFCQSRCGVESNKKKQKINKSFEQGNKFYHQFKVLPSQKTWSGFDIEDKVGYMFISKNIGWSKFIENISSNVGHNHKITNIEYIGKQTVYNITVEDTHIINVILENEKGLKSCLFVPQCGEQPLYIDKNGEGSSCNLGSINLKTIFDETKTDKINWVLFENLIRIGVQYLDEAIDTEVYFSEGIEKNQKRFRDIGLGIMGYADLLILMKLKYGSKEALDFTDVVMLFMLDKAYFYSAQLACEKGKAPIYNDIKLNDFYLKKCSVSTQKYVNKYGLRNGKLLTTAPGGSISMLLNVNGGLEPYYQFEYERDDILGKRIITPEIVNELKLRNQYDEYKKYLISAEDVTAENHIKTQSTISNYQCGSSSKTINLPADATKDDVSDAYILAHSLGIKGTTVYRDGCRAGVLNKITNTDENKVLEHELIRQFKDAGDEVIIDGINPPSDSHLVRTKIKTNKGKKYYFMVGYVTEHKNKPFEFWIFTNHHEKTDIVNSLIVEMNDFLISKKIKTDLIIKMNEKMSSQNNVDKIARMISMSLRHNVKIIEIVNVLEKYTESISSLIFWIRKHLLSLLEDGTEVENEICPICGNSVIYESSCIHCIDSEFCGWSRC